MRLGARSIAAILLARGAAALSQPAAAPAELPERVASALRLLPGDDLRALLIVPGLKRASDGLTTLLEGMDRVDLLVGTRPIDHARSLARIGGGLDDAGALLAGLTPAGAFAILPASDAAALVAGLPAQPAAPRAEARHVLLRSGPGVAASPPRGEAGLAWWTGGAPAGVRDRALTADLAILIHDARALPDLLRRVASALDGDGRAPIALRAAIDAAAPLADRVAAGLAAASMKVLLSVECDPLALVIEVVLFKADVAGGAAGAPVAASAPALPPRAARAPAAILSRPFYLSGAIDAAALLEDPAARAALEAWWPAAALPEGLADRVRVAVFPNPSGHAAGVLSESIALLETADPQAARAWLRGRVEALGAADGRCEVEASWSDGDAGAPCAYELRVREFAADASPLERALPGTLMGQMGWRGFVAEGPGGLIVTCNRRPALLEWARAAAAAPPQPLEEHAAMPTMRRWMPADAEVQALIDPGAVGGLLAQVESALPVPAAGLPRLEPGLPPVGLALDARGGTVVATLVVPAPVLAPLLDAARRAAGAGMVR
jgi:hypothetical protein